MSSVGHGKFLVFATMPITRSPSVPPVDRPHVWFRSGPPFDRGRSGRGYSRLRPFPKETKLPTSTFSRDHLHLRILPGIPELALLSRRQPKNSALIRGWLFSRLWLYGFKLILF